MLLKLVSDYEGKAEEYVKLIVLDWGQPGVKEFHFTGASVTNLDKELLRLQLTKDDMVKLAHVLLSSAVNMK